MYGALESRFNTPVTGKLTSSELIEALRENILREQESVKIHLSLAEDMVNLEAKQVLLDLASEEISHVQRLSTLVQTVIREKAASA
jgi:rubrerythrin